MRMDVKTERLKRIITERVYTEYTPHYAENTNWVFDFRAVMLSPDFVELYTDTFWEIFEKKLPFQLCALETSGISLVAAIVARSIERGTPITGFYLRKSRKKTDLTKIIEGTPTHEPVIVVDDLTNSGRSINFIFKILKEANLKPLHVFTLLRFREKDAYAHIEQTAPLTTLFTLPDFGKDFFTTHNNDISHTQHEILWRFQSKNPSHGYVVEKSAPVIDRNRVYVGSDNGIFWALDQHDGSVAWHYPIKTFTHGKGIFSNPALHDDTVYFGAYDGNVYALDAETGKKKWINFDADWIGSSPTLAPDLNLLFIGLEFGLWKKHGGISAISLETGKTVWDYTEMPEHTHGSPCYIPKHKVVVIGSNDGVVYCFDGKKGTLQWKYKTDGEIKSGMAYDKQSDLIFFGSLDGCVYALHARDGALAWKYETEIGFYSTPLVVDGTVYVTGLDKQLHALDTQTGEKQWQFAARGRIFSSPTYFKDSVWFGANDGVLYEIDPHTGHSQSFLQLTERIVNAVAYNEATDTIFVPTNANEIYCVRKTTDKIQV